MEFKGMSMSQLIEAHNVLATEKGMPHKTEFKNLAEARTAITNLESKMEDGNVAVQADPAAATGAVEGTEGAVSATTSASCIAYYKAALKNPNLGKRKGGAAAQDPAALRAKAAELMAAAQAAEAANADAAVKAAEEAVENAKKAQAVAEAALAAQAALKEQQAAAAAQAPAA